MEGKVCGRGVIGQMTGGKVFGQITPGVIIKDAAIGCNDHIKGIEESTESKKLQSRIKVTS